MKLSEFLRCPIKVQRCAGRIEQKELIVQVDHMDVVPGDIVIFEPGDLFPGDIRLLSSKHLVVRYLSRKQFACQLTKCHLVISLTS
jgi:P-type Mg2+ transporter